MLTGSKVESWNVSVYRTKCKKEPHGIQFLRSWNVEMKYTNWQSSKSGWEKWDQLSGYDGYSLSHGD